MIQRLPPPLGFSAGTASVTGSGTLVFSNSNGVSFGLSGSTLTASAVGGGGGGIDVSLSGNTTGTLALVSSGTLILAGGNNVTLSQNGQSVTISGATIPSTAGLISAVNVSAGATSNNLSALTFSNSNGLAFGLSGSTITGSYTVPTVTNSSWTVSDHATSQTVAQLAFTQSNGLTLSLSTGAGGSATVIGSYTVPSTAGLLSAVNVSAGATSNNLSAITFSNSNGISFGLSASTVTASYTVPSTAGLISGLNLSGGAGNSQSNVTGITFSNSNGITFGVSTGANVATVTASYTVPTQTNQTGNVYASSNTFGTSSGTYDARSLSIAGSGAVNVAASNSGWVISAPAQTNQTLSVIVSSNTAGNTSGMTVDARSISFQGYGNASVGLSTTNTGSTVMVSVSTAAQTNQTGNVYASSNTTGTSSGTYDARSLSIAGAGEVSVAASNSGWVISSPVQSIGVSTGGNTSGNTGTYSGQVIFVGGNNVTLSVGTAAGGAQTITISGANAGGAQTGISSVAASGGTQTAGMISFINSNNLTFGMSTGAVTGSITASFALNVSAGGGTSNALSGITFSNSNNVTFGLSTGAGVGTITASITAQSNQSGNVYASSNTFGTSSGTYDARSISIAGSGAVNVAASNSGWVISAPTQTNQTLSFAATSNTAGNTSGMSVDARSITMAGYGAVSVGYSTSAGGSSVVVSVATQTHDTGNLYASSNTFGTSSGTYDLRTISIAGSGAVNVAASNSGWVISAPTQTNQSGNVYASSNTTGTSSGTYDARTLSIAGAAVISVAASNSGFVISSPMTSSLSATGIVSISTNGSTISIGAIATTLSSYENIPLMGSQTQTFNGASVSGVVAFFNPVVLSVSFVRFPIVMTTGSTTLATTASSASASAAIYSTWNAVVYSLANGANSQSLTSVASGSAGFTQLNSISVAANGTQYSITQAFTYQVNGGQTNTSTGYSISNSNYSFSTGGWQSIFTGTQFLDVNFANSLAPGAYWLVLGYSSSTAANSTKFSNATACNVVYSNHYVNTQPNFYPQPMGSAGSISGYGLLGGGSFSTAGGGTTAAFPISAISSSASNCRQYFQMLQSS